MDPGDQSDHSGHSMPMPDMPRMCSMNMLWNSQVEDVCVVFESWHIRGPGTMLISCLAIMAISMIYARLLSYTRNFDRQIAYVLYTDSKTTSNPASRRESLIPGLSTTSGRRESLITPNPTGYAAIETGAGRLEVTRLSLRIRVLRAGLYAIAVGISFWLMLVAMTYNTYLFGSIVIGAFLGHVVYEGDLNVGATLAAGNSKGLACH